jgi:hypothetical protein
MGFNSAFKGLKGLPFGSSKEYDKCLCRCAGEILPSEVGKMSEQKVLCNMERRTTSTLNAGWEGET